MPGRSFSARIERHHPDMPVYCIVPREIPAAWGETRTFSAEATLNGKVDLGRRGIKPWGDGRWFLELTAAQCRKAGVAEGDEAEIALERAPEMPEELSAAIDKAGVRAAWARLTPSARRQSAETVFGAKRPDTRAARVEKIVAALRRP